MPRVGCDGVFPNKLTSTANQEKSTGKFQDSLTVKVMKSKENLKNSWPRGAQGDTMINVQWNLGEEKDVRGQ